jgi:hypothetical protein
VSEKNDALLAAGFLAFMDKAVIKEMASDVRAGAVQHCEPGESGTIRNPLDGEKVARYSVTDPGWTGHVSNRSAVDRWVRARYPEKTERRDRITDMAEAIAVLKTVRPDLVEEYDLVPDHVAESLVRRSEQAQEPCGWGGETGAQAPPGIEVLPPKPVLRIVLDKDNAVPGYRALWEAGVFSVTGEVKQIEGGQQ